MFPPPNPLGEGDNVQCSLPLTPSERGIMFVSIEWFLSLPLCGTGVGGGAQIINLHVRIFFFELFDPTANQIRNPVEVF